MVVAYTPTIAQFREVSLIAFLKKLLVMNNFSTHIVALGDCKAITIRRKMVGGAEHHMFAQTYGSDE